MDSFSLSLSLSLSVGALFLSPCGEILDGKGTKALPLQYTDYMLLRDGHDARP